MKAFAILFWSLSGKANEKGHLFDGVDAKEIAGLVEEKTKAKIPAECVNLEKTIKEVGKYKISIQKGDQEVPFEIEIKALIKQDLR